MLSTPPAFVLSQDQTLHDIWKSVWLLFIDWYYSLFDVLYNRTSHVGVHSVHCSVFKGHHCHRFIATTCISYQTPRSLSSPDLNFFQLNQCRSAKRTHTDTTKQTYRFFRPSQYSWFLYNRTSHVGVHSVHCSVFKGHRCHHRVATTCLF